MRKNNVNVPTYFLQFLDLNLLKFMVICLNQNEWKLLKNFKEEKLIIYWQLILLHEVLISIMSKVYLIFLSQQNQNDIFTELVVLQEQEVLELL